MHTNPRKPVRIAECVLLFAGVPLVLTLWRLDPQTPAGWLGIDTDRAVWLSRVVVTGVFFVAGAGVLVALLRDRSFDRARLWRVRPSVPGRSMGRELVRILSIWLLGGVAVAAIVRAVHPDWFLLLPRERPGLWVAIALLYPVFSVLPQGVIYRAFFFHRYGVVLGRWTPWVAAIAFAAMHAVFLNWIAPVLCLIGGALFAWTYARTRSALLAWLEHSLHGVTAFSLGLGLYFFLGAPRRERADHAATAEPGGRNRVGAYRPGPRLTGVRIDRGAPTMCDFVTLPAESNQALGIARYAIGFIRGAEGERGDPARSVLEKTAQFFTDAAICGYSALALRTNAPTVLRDEALGYPVAPGTPASEGCVHAGAKVFGSDAVVSPEKAIVANCSAVREWDSNGTNFGYNPRLGHTAGEFGHNDFYAVAVAGAQQAGMDGAAALRAMVCHDEIRGRLAEVFSLKSYKIDHVLHGGIASAAVYGALIGATAEQIESAIGMVVAHAVPFRAIRAGKQLSDSKGASAAITTEFAVQAVRRSMRGFRGPRDIFRNPEAVFRLFEGPGQMFVKVGDDRANTEALDASPFELVLARAGADFAVMGMHFKLGLYEHQSAGALQAVIDLVEKAPQILDDATGDAIGKITILAYEPAFGIIGDPAKRDPKTRQSADHSMVYIVSTLLRKALESRGRGRGTGWTDLMLSPYDYSGPAITNTVTRELMKKIRFEHGGPDYDAKYPDGIPTSVVVELADGTEIGSGLVMYPAGHARNTTAPLDTILAHKFDLLGRLAFDEPGPVVERLMGVGTLSAEGLWTLHDGPFAERDDFADAN